MPLPIGRSKRNVHPIPVFHSPTFQFQDEILATKEGKFIKENIDTHAVLLFSKTTCNFCKMAKKTLNNLNVNYQVEEIDGKDNMTAIQDVFEKLTGARTVKKSFK